VPRVAVIGCGSIAQTHIPAIQSVPALSLAGVFDADPDRARRTAERYQVARIFESWAEVLADPTVEVVALLLPHDLHCAYTVEALAAGKHVVVEKPMAVSLAEADEMIAAARRYRRVLMPVHNRLFDPAVEKLRDLVASGAIGEVYLAQTNGWEPPSTVSVRPWLGTGRGGGGVFMAQAVHAAYLLRALVGEVARIAAFEGGRKVVPMQDEDTMVATLTFRNGAVGVMTATFAQATGPGEHSVTLFGTAGWACQRLAWAGEERRQELLVVSPTLFGDTAIHALTVPTGNAFARLWQRFAESLQAGQEPPVTAQDGRAAVEIILAGYRSAETGTVVSLPLEG